MFYICLVTAIGFELAHAHSTMLYIHLVTAIGLQQTTFISANDHCILHSIIVIQLVMSCAVNNTGQR